MLVDTSVLIRTLQPHHSLYIYADRAIRLLPEQGMKLHIVAQNLIELWTSSVPMATSVGVQDAYFGRHRLSPLDRVGSAATVGSQNVSFYPYGKIKEQPERTTTGSLGLICGIQRQGWTMQ
jgi:hypothetical protein